MTKKNQNKNYLFTSESVTEGHPDKLADQISDAILDDILASDPDARVAAETLVTTGMVLISGEITTDCYTDMPRVVRDTVASVGYDDPQHGFDASTCAVLTSIDEQSPDIAQGVNEALEVRSGHSDHELGAGDQGLMFGFACQETPELMPLPISLAHALSRRLAEVRKQGELDYLLPDGKTQVTVEYDREGKPRRIHTIVMSAQHLPSVGLERIQQDLVAAVIDPAVPSEWLDGDTRFLVNPTGRFVTGGPQGDTGLTGRKLMVDTYGGMARHGGGAFSGKDPTKVDRSAAYAARHVAKNIVAAGLAERCEVQLAYAIGVAEPVSILVETFGTGVVGKEGLSDLVRELWDLRPQAIIKAFDLQRPIYRQVAAYGHFGRSDLDLPWERLDKVEALRRNCTQTVTP